MKKIIGKEEALRFARYNCKLYLENNLKQIENFLKDDERRNDLKKALEIDGFSEIVEVYNFRYECYPDQESGYQFDVAYFCLRIIQTGEVFSVVPESWNSKRYKLLLLNPAEGRCTYFRYDEPAPNYIGKATRKKIEDWIQFCHRKNDAEIRYMAEAESKNREFRYAVLKKFPDAKCNVLEDGWMSECSFNYQMVNVHYTANEDGTFSRDLRVDIVNFPGYYELVGMDDK